MKYAAQKRWLAKPGNKEKHRLSVSRCRQRPEAKEAHRKRQLKYAAMHREQERLRAARWRAENPQREKQMKRHHYVKNAEKIKARNKAFRNAHPERYREYRNDYQARKRAASFEKLPRGFKTDLLIKQNGRCAACEALLMVTGKHLDHIKAIVKGGAHTPHNLQYLCPTCNRRKAARDFDAFLRLLGVEKC